MTIKFHFCFDQLDAEEQNGEDELITDDTKLQNTMQVAGERALCCALAQIAGKLTGTTGGRSLLSAHAGLTAYKLIIPDHMTAHRKGLAFSLLGRHLNGPITDSIRNLAFIKNRKVCHLISFCK